MQLENQNLINFSNIALPNKEAAVQYITSYRTKFSQIKLNPKKRCIISNINEC